MKYFLWMKQAGEGCDYTIGCGEKLIELNADTPGRAVVEATERIKEYVSTDRPLAKAMLLRSFEDLTKVCDDTLAAAKHVERAFERDKKRREIERLKAELGDDE